MKSLTNNHPQEFWYVAYVRSCRERKTADFLSARGIQFYLPVQKERRRWSDRIKIVDKLVLPGMIFIHTTPSIRVSLLKDSFLIYGYMSKGGSYNPVTISESQIDDFRFVLEHGEDRVTVSDDIFAPGDAVEVISGSLKGLKAEFVNISGQHYAAVRIENLCTAIVRISLNEIRKIG